MNEISKYIERMIHYKTHIQIRCTFKEIEILVGLDRLSAIVRGVDLLWFQDVKV